MELLRARLLFFIIAIFAFHSFAADSYVLVLNQNVNTDSTSVIENGIYFSALHNYFSILGGGSGAEIEQKFKDSISPVLQQTCEKIIKKDKTVECTADDLVLKLKRNFTSKEGYYKFEVTGEFPYRTYRLTVNSLPVDKFGKLIQFGLGSGNPDSESAFSIFSGAVAIDLKKKDDNAVAALGYEFLGLDVLYSVSMPGEITRASAGSYNAEILGSKANFDMVSVMKDSSPLVIESRELNIFLIVLLTGFLLLIAISVAFFYFKKNE